MRGKYLNTHDINSLLIVVSSKSVKFIKALGTDLNRNYGMVSTELKKDTRSIEQTLNDIQQKKRLKTQHQTDNI